VGEWIAEKKSKLDFISEQRWFDNQVKVDNKTSKRGKMMKKWK